jgi:hypothetical protein
VVCSASLDLTTMRSSRGLMETDTCDLPFGNVEDGQGRTSEDALYCDLWCDLSGDWWEGLRRGVDLLTARS